MFPRVRRTLLHLILMVSVFVPLVFSAPRLQIEPPASQISSDQIATLKVRLEWPQSEGPYEINPLEPKLENLVLENQNQAQETGETVSQTFSFEFRPVRPGNAVIYPFEISYRKTETEPWVPILVPEQKIKVVSSFPLKAILTGLGIAAGLIGIFAGLAIGKSLKVRTAAQNIPPRDPKQPVYAKAEETIAMFNSPNPKEKLTCWSNQLRTVVAAYYDIPSKTTPSTEILSFLKNKGLPAGEWNEISRLFEQLTELQYSRQDIPAYDLDRMQKTLLQYVKGKIIIGNSNF